MKKFIIFLFLIYFIPPVVYANERDFENAIKSLDVTNNAYFETDKNFIMLVKNLKDFPGLDSNFWSEIAKKVCLARPRFGLKDKVFSVLIIDKNKYIYASANCE